MMINTEIFHTLRPDPQLMRKAGPMSCLKFSLPGLALSFVLLLASSIATATTSSATNSSTITNTAVKASANSTTSSTAGLLPADIGRIKQPGELVVLEVDLAKSIARALNVEVRFNREAKSFNEVAELVVCGRATFGISKLSLGCCHFRAVAC